MSGTAFDAERILELFRSECDLLQRQFSDVVREKLEQLILER